MIKNFILLSLVLLFAACKKEMNKSNPTGPQGPPPQKLQLTAHWYVPGINSNGIPDSFALHFNRPVRATNIYFNRDYCLPDLQYNNTKFDSTVYFTNFLCGALGAENPFMFSVVDSAGETLTDSITYVCYTKKYITKGLPVKYYVSADNKYCWVLTQYPSQIVCFGIADTSYKQEIDVPFMPFNLAYNSYNARFYVLCGDYAHRDSIYVFNPASGLVERSIPVLPDSLSNPQHPETIPYGIAFGSNGFGILMVEDDSYNPRWKIIDSKLNDSIYISPDFPGGIGNTRLASFASAYTNFDQSKLIMLENYGSCRLAVLDCISHNLVEVEHSLSPQYYSEMIVPNKTNDKVFFINAPNGQFIFSGGNIIGYVAAYDALATPSADFSYRANETNYIYYLDGNAIGIVDFNNGNIHMFTNFKADLKNIQATTDGKYLLAMGSSYLELFSTDIYFKPR